MIALASRKLVSAVMWTVLASGTSAADTLVAARTMQPNEVFLAEDVKLAANATPGALDRRDAVIGRAAKRTIYQGRPIMARDIGMPAIIERNQIVLLVFRAGPLSIETEGRALDRGSIGERVRAINLTSRTTVTGRVDQYGAIHVGN